MTVSPPRGAKAKRIQGLVFLVILGTANWVQGGQHHYPRVPAKTSEFCTVCGASLTVEDVTLIVRGRRIPLCGSEVETFMGNQEKYFSSKQSRSALFQEDLSAPSGTAQGGISLGWFLFGLVVLSSLVFGGLSAYRALSKGLSPLASFFTGFFLNVLGYLYVFSRPAKLGTRQIPKGLVKVPTTAQPVPCPACADLNHPAARQCLSCGQDLRPSEESEVARA